MSEKVSVEDIDSEQNYEKSLTLNLVFLSLNTTPKSNLKTKKLVSFFCCCLLLSYVVKENP